jgi:orotidine-5'-phosphate decarboxylase
MSKPLAAVAVALDTADWGEYRAWCQLFGPRVGVLKVGLEAFVRWGPPAVEAALATNGRIFLDLKLHDIPNTVAGATAAARDLGVRYLTVHASGGAPMLAAAAEAAAGQVQLLAVTVLTSLDDSDLARLGMPGSSGARAADWAAMAATAGCAGVVCSPLELARLRPLVPTPFLLVTPGIRPAERDDDQRRTATPAAALAAGADLLVIGRPLTRAPSPEAALDELSASLGNRA